MRAGITRGPFRHNAFGLLGWKQSTQGTPAARIHMVYDLDGKLMPRRIRTRPTVREYIWLNGRPMAIYDDVQTGTPTRPLRCMSTSSTAR